LQTRRSLRQTRRVAITALILYGRVVTFDPTRPVIDDGALYIGADERIAAVQRRADPAPSGFEAAARLETGGCIYPGLIDLHNHMAYNVLSLWSPPGRTEPYTSRYQWPDERSYEGMISDPANALGALAGKAHLKYVEAKAVIGGVTAIQGSAKMAHPYEGWLVRNVEYETFKTGKKSVYQSALPLRSDADYADYRRRWRPARRSSTTSPRGPIRSWSPSTRSFGTRAA
jgi:5-methylthioadenosine/S-adenosylhomocysteine deaminase